MKYTTIAIAIISLNFCFSQERTNNINEKNSTEKIESIIENNSILQTKSENKSINEIIVKIEDELTNLKSHKEFLIQNTSENSEELKMIKERIVLKESKLREIKNINEPKQ